jgi:hypothetical protein
LLERKGRMKKFVFILIIAVLSIGGSGFMLDQMLTKQGGIGYISSAIEAMRIRSAKPGMPPEQIAREAATANKGAMGLLKTLANGASHGLGAKPAEPAESATASIKHASEALAASKQVMVEETKDGREVIGIIHDRSIEDLTAVDRINAMNIPDNMREKILANYYKTGVLPEIFVKEKRKPSKNSGDPDDPYNSNNF